MDAAVGIVKAYLELCGYFVLAELPVRKRVKSGYRDVTDLDIVAVRFPHAPTLPRTELDVLLGIDPALGTPRDALDVVIGEVKQGKAELNPGIRRRDTIALALRRVGCCREDRVADEAATIARRGWAEMSMPGGGDCRVRVVAFAGRGSRASGAALTMSLGRCADVIAERLREAGGLLVGADLKDPILELFALQQKLARDTVASGGG